MFLAYVTGKAGIWLDCGKKAAHKYSQIATRFPGCRSGP